MKNIEIKDALPQFYLPFSAYVIRTRALPDARDGLKTGARYILYSQKKDKLTYDKKYKKGIATITAGMRFSPHGDASILGNVVRMSQPFALRYPVIDVQGNNGSILEGDDFSAARYLEIRSNKLASEMVNLLDKGAIKEWKLNYTEEEEYPVVLPTKFPYGLVNGNTGIGVGCASSIPQFNLREVSDALIKVLYNKDAAFEELYCLPDFATGGIIINEGEIKEPLRTGSIRDINGKRIGQSIKIRAKIEYDADNNELIVKEVPYQVYTSTICGQLEKAIEEGKILGVEKFFDGTDYDSGAWGTNIRIKLTKAANPERVCRQLYKETSLQYHYSINMMMLRDGTKPELFGWRDMLVTYLEHLKNVIKNAYEFDLNKMKLRLEILNGYLRALEDIDNVVKVIKSASSAAQAIEYLREKFGFSELQAKAILDLKLQRLVNMEKIKIENERDQILEDVKALEIIINDEEVFLKEVEKEILRIKKEYGDARRTQVINLTFNDDDEEEPAEKKNIIAHLTNFGNLYATETTTLMVQKRGGKGSNIKLGKDEFIIDTISNTNNINFLLFTSKGKVYTTMIDNIPLNVKVPPQSIFEMDTDEKATNLITFDKFSDNKYIIFTTRKGMVKKSELEEYRIKKGRGVTAIKLKDGDSLVSISFTNDDNLGILTKMGYSVILDIDKINAIGRITSGVIGIKLSEGDEVVDSKIIPKDTKEIISISKLGLIKRTTYEDFGINTRGTKGNLMQKLKEEDNMAHFNVLNGTEREIIIVSNIGAIKFNVNEVQLSSKGALGTMAKKMNSNEFITTIIKGA